MKISIVVCVDIDNGISLNGQIPWKFKKDLKLFKNLTEKSINPLDNIDNNNITKPNVVIMGRKTYEDIPTIYRPLKNRINIVLTSNKDYNDGDNNIIVKTSIIDILLYLQENKKEFNEVFIIGGSLIYKQFLDLKIVNTLYVTRVYNSFSCDNHFYGKLYGSNNMYRNDIQYKYFKSIKSDTFYDNDLLSNNFIDVKMTITQYDYVNKEETKYLDMVQKILKKGVYNLDRTNVGTLSLFGKSFKYDIRNYRLPLFTHRKMFFRGIVEELLFFISGSPDTKKLEEKNVKIWTGNTSREFLDSRGLHHFREGEYGESYGFNLRNYGAKYEGPDANYTNKGYDQLQHIIYLLQNNPTSRRILFTYHNPDTIDRIPLPACHILYQFYVDTEKGELSCSFTMRSNDYILANCFNVCSAALLVFMLCHITNLKPGKIIINIGNIHIYNNHIEETKKMLNNKPLNFPILHIDDSNNEIKSIDDFKYENFKVLLYNSYGKYTFKMAV